MKQTFFVRTEMSVNLCYLHSLVTNLNLLGLGCDNLIVQRDTESSNESKEPKNIWFSIKVKKIESKDPCGLVAARYICHIAANVGQLEVFERNLPLEFAPDSLSIASLKFPDSTKTALWATKLMRVCQLQQLTKEELLMLPNFNEVSVKGIINTLNEQGFKLSTAKIT